VLAALFGLSACGSAHRARSGYSVRRVVSAFTANGVTLHKAHGACSTGFVCLDSGDEGVQAYVFVGPKAGLIALGTGGVGGDSTQETDKANVTVVWQRRYRKPVRTALQSLR
jgi:hypothetical protein